MSFEIIGEIEEIENIAIGGKIRDIMRLQKQFGSTRWRKLKGFAWLGFRAGTFEKLNCTGMRPTVLVKRKLKSNGFWIKLWLKQRKIRNLRFA